MAIVAAVRPLSGARVDRSHTKCNTAGHASLRASRYVALANDLAALVARGVPVGS
jgi:hypothetical protein